MYKWVVVVASLDPDADAGAVAVAGNSAGRGIWVRVVGRAAPATPQTRNRNPRSAARVVSRARASARDRDFMPAQPFE
ncbi:MAG: hypothetical protein ACT4O1_15145 [Gemmatimonadota bacterium]